MPRYAELASGRAVVVRVTACCLLPSGSCPASPGDQPSLQLHIGKKLSQTQTPCPTGGEASAGSSTPAGR